MVPGGLPAPGPCQSRGPRWHGARVFDSERPLPVNQGILSNELVARDSTGRLNPRITWIDPDSRESWPYLTNERKLPPGLIVLLHRRRRDLEKVYDPFKNKFHEKKSWQAHSLCLLHNLMVCYEASLTQAGIRNEAEEKRRKKVLTERTASVEKAGRRMPLIISGIERLTQRTVKFIRWLRHLLWQNRPLAEIRLILKKTLCHSRTFSRTPLGINPFTRQAVFSD